jgi:hypothetical protein
MRRPRKSRRLWLTVLRADIFKGLTQPFNAPMSHVFENEVGGPAHEREEQKDEQHIDDLVFGFGAHREHSRALPIESPLNFLFTTASPLSFSIKRTGSGISAEK